MGSNRVSQLSHSPGNRDACLYIRSTPRLRRRSYCRDRQCDPQIDAGRQAACSGRIFFSLGHSTIVVALSIGIAITATALQSKFDNFTSIGGIVGTLVSASFLFAIAIANIVILRSIYRTFQIVKNGGKFVEEDLDLMLSQRGFMGRILRRFFHLIERSWHMYPLGLLFGLGFDTATEVGLLGIPRPRPLKACRPGRYWCFRRCSLPECH